MQVEGAALDDAANFYVVADSSPQRYATFKYASDGNEVWAAFNPTYNVESVAHGLAVDCVNNVFVTGQKHDDFDANSAYGTYKSNSNGAWIWANSYPQNPLATSISTSIALDQANNVYVTGYSPGTNSRQ